MNWLRAYIIFVWEKFLKNTIAFILSLFLTGCSIRSWPAIFTPGSLPAISGSSGTPGPGSLPAGNPTLITQPSEELCAFVEGRQQLKEISGQFLAALQKAALPVKTARAEAYGENCIAANGQIVRFSARETDYYVELSVADLKDESGLGLMLEKILEIIDQFPIDQTPGPNPGYIGISFEAGDQVRNLWFTRSQAGDLIKQGLKGADLFRGLNAQP